ncbi:MAG: M48 family metalloprotease [Alphaproteobacteria bacterium]|nr:M48 family metalloprotease [Alphaproteobacteria bacterium]
MMSEWTNLRGKGKSCSQNIILAFCVMFLLSACSVNPATGDRQFTALLPTTSEARVGAEEHAKIAKAYGNFVKGPVADYVSRIGQKVAKNTERKDVTYRFYVIDSPMVNAFALPGGYIYVSRGLLSLANSEAELAAVLGHEIGHVTARHAAERMSQGAVVGIGATVLGAVAGSSAVSQAANLGSNLYLKSYSRGQEHQSDELGVRYLSRAGYDPHAMADFLRSLDAQSQLERKEAGKSGTGFNYFSTHPLTAERVAQAGAEAQKYPNANGVRNRAAYLQVINGMTYGDSAAQGFARGSSFYHPTIGFAFDLPQGTKIMNSPAQVVGTHSNGTVIVFDAANDKAKSDPLRYLTQVWLRNEKLADAAEISVNGMRAATASFAGNVKGRAVTVRLVVIEWKAGEFFRFQMAIPKGMSSSFMNQLKKASYSFRRLSESEKRSIQPKKIRVVVAEGGASVSSMAAKMDVEGDKLSKFLILNGMRPSDKVIAGQPYKVVIN